MDDKFPKLRGLINDLVRTITGATVHMDDYLLNCDKNSVEYEDALLADEQISMALEYLIELRSLYTSSVQYGNYNNQTAIDIHNKINLLNNFITAINISAEFIDKYGDTSIINEIISNILNSINIIKPLINEYYIQKPSKILKVSDCCTINSKSKGKTAINRMIMVVDDIYCIRDVINKALIKHGYIVINCGTGEKAISLFEIYKNQLFLIIVDICLPDINGLDLCKKLVLKKSDINILFTSGFDNEQLRGSIVNFGNCQFLSKPFSLDTLLTIINNIK